MRVVTGECISAPGAPVDGERFYCPGCGYTATFVVLPDGRPGEWVSS